MTLILSHSYAMLRTSIGRTVLTGLTLVATPALLTAQDCLGLHAPRSVPVVELTAGFLRDGVTGPSTLGLGVTKGALFGLVETGADVAAGQSAFAVNGYGATAGYRRAVRGVALCGGASLSGETIANGSTNAGSIFAAAGVKLPTLLKQLPLTAFGVAALESRTTSPDGAGDLSDRGVALRAGLSSYPREWVGVRIWQDLANGDHRFGMSVSLNRNLRKPVVDGDGDGVLDTVDACPNTPAGTKVDGKGCPLPPPPPADSDNDGVIDTVDACPNTPAGTKVDGTGCPLPPPDSDGDGVIDSIDACPNTPAGTAVDGKGCPLPPPDADGDGVPDAMDACPATPAGTTVDAKGCPPIFEGASFTLVGVTFETARSVLRPTSIPVLDEVAAKLLANPTVRVEIAGHTDSTGNAATNLRLSQARAETVRQYFIGKGIAADRLTARGYGSTKPVATNTTVAGRAENRRVELTKLD